MATFSQQFLANLGRPQFAQGMFGLGQAIGGIPGQLQQSRLRQQLAEFDTTTLAGRKGMLESQLEQTEDPQQRLALGEKISQIEQQEQAEELRTTQTENVKQLANQIETELGDPELADLVRSEQVSVAQGRAEVKNHIKAREAAKRGKAAQLRYLTSVGLGDSELKAQIEAGEYEGVDEDSFARLVTNMQKTEKEEKLLTGLRQRGEVGQQVAEELELGMITNSQISDRFQKLSAGEPTTEYANKKRMVLDGKVVWTADVTKPGEDEFPGYMDPETKEWKPVDADRLQKISEEQEQSLKDINQSDLVIAATYLGKDDNYTGLSQAEKDQAQFKFAFRVNELIRNKEVDSVEEAYEKAYEERGEFQKEGFFAWLFGSSEKDSGTSVDRRGRPKPKKDADEYIEEAKQVPQQ